MSVRFEYTKYLADGQIALTEHLAWSARMDNLLKENLSTEERLLVEKVCREPNAFLRLNEHRLLLELAGQTRKLWPEDKGVLWVYFFEGDTARSRRVLDIANEWSRHCGIRFDLSTTRAQADIRVSFEDDGSWSYIGTDAQGVPRNEATMNFGWLVDDTEDEEWVRVVLHEFGHALGLVHEHQREDAAMDWNFDFIYNWCMFKYGWDKRAVQVNFFDVVARTETNHSAHVDRDSIMAYDIPPEFTKSGRTFNAGHVLSPTDIQHIGTIYPKVDLLLS